MKTKERRLNYKVIACGIAFIVALIAIAILPKYNMAFADTQSIYEDKIYSNFTMEDDFDDSCVIVVMDKAVGGINKEHDIAFFGNAYLASASTFAN